jgi:predicted transcriptional regulator
MDVFKTPPALSAEQRVALAVALSNIAAHQSEGRTCYAVTPDFAIEITPQMSAEHELAQAIRGGLKLCEDLHVRTDSSGHTVFSGCQLNPGCFIDQRALTRALATVDLESPEVFAQAESVVEQFFGHNRRFSSSGHHHSEVYSDLIEALPVTADDDVVTRFVHPLVHRLESSGLCRAAMNYLAKRQLPAEQIEQIRLQEIEPERLARWLESQRAEAEAHFVERTGIAPRQIRTLEELIDAAEGPNKPGSPLGSYLDYLRSLRPDCPRAVVDNVVMRITAESSFVAKTEALRTLYRLGYVDEGDRVSAQQSTLSSLRARHMLQGFDNARLQDQLQRCENGRVAASLIANLRRAAVSDEEIQQVLLPLARDGSSLLVKHAAEAKLEEWGLEYLV